MSLESLKDFAVLSEVLHRKLQVKTKPHGVDLASSIRMFGVWTHTSLSQTRRMQFSCKYLLQQGLSS